MPNLSKLAYARRMLILKWRRFLGLCTSCGAEACGNSMCDQCQERATNRIRLKRIQDKQSGLCQECGNHPVNNSRYRCDACLELMRIRRKPNQCHSDGCFNDVLYSRHYCQECIDKKEAEKQVSKVYFIECSECNQLFTSNHAGNKACDGCKPDRLNRLYRERKGLELLIKTCAYYRCGKTFETYNNRKTTCSELCSKRMIKKNRNQKERFTRHPKRLGDKYIEKVDLKVLFLRDGGRCQICGRKLNLSRPNNHHLQSTIDHIIPIDCGGEHSYRNTQLACRQCNTVKSNSCAPGGDQMLLFGGV